MVAELCITVGIVLAGEDVPRAPHIGGQLVDLVDAVHHPPHQRRIAQVAQDEFVRRQGRVLMLLQIDGAHPVALVFSLLTR